MSQKRTLYILLSALLAQVALAAVLWWPHERAVAAEPLLAGFDAGQVSAITVHDADGQSVRLARAGEGWVLPDAEDYPALAANVTKALEQLAALTRGRAVTETAASHARLQVAEGQFVRQVTLTLADGATRTLYLGSSPSYSDSHVRLAGEDAVYLGRGLSAWEWGATPAGWVDTQYVNIPLEEVTAVQLRNAQGELLLTRRDDGGWALAGQPDAYQLDEGAVNTLVQRVTALRLAAPLGKTALPAYGLAAPLASITVDAASGETSVLLGAKQADGAYVAKSSAAEFVVSVASYTAEALIGVDAEALRLKPTPTPAAATP